MAPHSSTLVWKTPWTEEPGGLQSMGSRRVGHDWVTSLSLFTFMYWRRKWQPTPVFLPGESQRRESLVGCRLWGHTESDMTVLLAIATKMLLWNKLMWLCSLKDINIPTNGLSLNFLPCKSGDKKKNFSLQSETFYKVWVQCFSYAFIS